MKGCEAMKKLICAKEVEALEKQGQKVMYIDDNTLITPSAKDAPAPARRMPSAVCPRWTADGRT